MKLKLSLVILMLALCAGTVLAQTDTPSSDNTVSYNGINFSFPTSIATNVSITQVAGDDPSVQQPGGPVVKHTEFVFYTDTAPDSIFDGVGGIQIYNISDFKRYSDATTELQNLQRILAQRPDLSTFEVANADSNTNDLPFLPTMPAAQVIRAHANYIDTPSINGVSYIAAYRSDVSPFTADQFIYTFQGLSADGSKYIAALFKPTTTLFPADIPANFDYDTFDQQLQTYMTQSIATLNGGKATDFTPVLTDFDSIVQTISFAGASAGAGTGTTVGTPQPSGTEAATQEVITDPTMGGLAGKTWTLISYGDAANPTAVVGTQPVTIMFTQSGVNGNGGCNGYGGSFQFSVNTLSVSQIIHTMMACSDQRLNDQENTFLSALTKATGFQVNGDQLQILYDGGVLNFQAS